VTGISIRPLRRDEAPVCERILRALPEWFGIEEALQQYVHDVTRLATIVAAEGEAVVGFLTLRRHGSSSAEIHAMAERPDRHGRGIGRALVEAAEARLRAEGTELFQVKTLGPSRPNEHYERTRGFYRRLGFVPLEENKLWGEVNPCLILVKHLPCSG
jgi:GNAT superfamily N-acetyltransferase